MIWFLLAGVFLLGAGCAALAIWFVQVRNLPGRGAHTGPMLAVPEVPARSDFGASARRRRGRLENGHAAGDPPGADRARLSPPAPGDVPPHPVYGPLSDTPPDGIEYGRSHGSLERGDGAILWSPDGVTLVPDEPLNVGGFPATRRRPVNGRSLGDRPRRNKQPWLTAEMPAVRVPDEAAPAWDPGDGTGAPVPLARPYSPQALSAEQVDELRVAAARGYLEACAAETGEVTQQDLEDAMDSLRHLPAYRLPVATERPLGLADLGPADAHDRTLAERMMP